MTMTKYSSSNPQQELMLLRARLQTLPPGSVDYQEVLSAISMLENQAKNVDRDFDD